MKKIFIITSLFAQPSGGNQRQTASAAGRFFGKAVDSTGSGIGDVSVLLLQNRFDSATKK